MDKNDKTYMPLYSANEFTHIGRMWSKISSNINCDSIIELMITSNGYGISYLLISFEISPKKEFKYNTIYKSGVLLDNILKYKIVDDKYVDIYCARSGIKLLAKIKSIGTGSQFELYMSGLDSLPDGVQDIVI
ncbi:hypothetical protein [Bacteroides mediterraneensis]|uniref:hypothetical protein n=1 Tax=Bacteroides mediterraneensis TaxID=1841856 RepID=UPI001114AABF|nr:hypothetical protein [Bacteroides mediterraneensis]